MSKTALFVWMLVIHIIGWLIIAGIHLLLGWDFISLRLLPAYIVGGMVFSTTAELRRYSRPTELERFLGRR